MKHEVRTLDVLSAEECAGVVDTVHRCRDAWAPMNARLPMYTLGAASYIEGGKGREARYLEKARAVNPLLQEHFGWLYQRLATVLGDALGGPVLYDADHLALPGFHVFLAHPAFTRPIASLHFDLQFEHVDWSARPDLDFSRQLSMTLALCLPASGGGLRLWDVAYAEFQEMPPAEQRRVRSGALESTLVAYAAGSMVVHSGLQLHQIAPVREMSPDDQRITLQAHTVPTDEGWLLYW
jgi:hypothetical protein